MKKTYLWENLKQLPPSYFTKPQLHCNITIDNNGCSCYSSADVNKINLFGKMKEESIKQEINGEQST